MAWVRCVVTAKYRNLYALCVNNIPKAKTVEIKSQFRIFSSLEHQNVNSLEQENFSSLEQGNFSSSDYENFSSLEHENFSSLEHEKFSVKRRQVDVLTEFLGCSRATAGLLLRKNEVMLKMNSKSYAKVATVCKNNFILSDVLDYPGILSLSAYEIQDRMVTLQEINCRDISPVNVVCFHQLLKRGHKRLYRERLIKCPSNILGESIYHLDCPVEMKQRIRSCVQYHLSKDYSSVTKLKSVANCEYLAWKLQCPVELVEKFQRSYHGLRTLSFAHLKRVIEILHKKFDIPISKICKCPGLLVIDCDDAEELLKVAPKICGISIQLLVNEYTKILKVPASSVLEIAKTLNDLNINKLQLLTCPDVLSLEPSTALSRLNFLYKQENFCALKEAPMFLCLLVDFDNLDIMNNLKMLHNEDILLSRLKSRYKLQDKKRILPYLSELFAPDVDVKKLLKKYSKNYRSGSQKNAERVVEYLFSNGVSKEQLLHGIGIVLYDYDIVVDCFEKMPHNELLQPFSEWLDNMNLVHLMVYFIEEPTNYSGDGVYRNGSIEIHEEFDEYGELDEDFNAEKEEQERLFSEIFS